MLAVERAQRGLKELGVERDLHRWALIDDVHRLLSFTDIRRVGCHFDAVFAEDELHRICLVRREQRNAANGFEQRLARDHHAFVAVAWNHLAVVGVVAVDELAAKQSVADRKRDLVVIELQDQVTVVAEQALQLLNRFRGDDNIRFVRCGKFQVGIDHCETASVGRHQRHLAVAERSENTVEHIAGLIGRDGIGSFFQTIAQDILRDLEFLGGGEIRQRRELALAEADDLEE